MDSKKPEAIKVLDKLWETTKKVILRIYKQNFFFFNNPRENHATSKTVYSD
jgi:hypothetical protein